MLSTSASASQPATSTAGIELSSVSVAAPGTTRDPAATASYRAARASASDRSGSAGSAADGGGLVEGDASALGPTDTSTGEGKDVTVVAKSSIAGTSANFVNSIIGAGIIGLPFAFNEAGFFSGIVLMLVVGGATYYSVQLIISLGVRLKQHDYEALVEHVLGRAGFYSVIAAMFMFAFGAMLAYMIIIGDTVGIVLAHSAGVEMTLGLRRLIICLASVVLILPLCLARDMATLSKTSFLSVLAVAWIIVTVIVRAFVGLGDARLPVTEAERELSVVSANFFPAVGVLAFAFVCHHNCFIVYNSLQDNTLPRWRLTSKISLGVAVAACMTLSVAGYLTFRHLTVGNLLNNYSTNDDLMNVTRSLYALTMVLTYPMEMFVARQSLDSLLFFGKGRATNCRHYTITLSLFVITLVIALVTDDLGFILELTGGIMGTYLAFILPVVLHLRCSDYRLAFWRNKGRVWATFTDMAPAVALLLFGIVVMVYGTARTIITAVEGHENEVQA